ncbi:MAG: MFS transporter [Roseiflexus sp.]|nr:MFS transporter [Roseiflexus sp.]
MPEWELAIQLLHGFCSASLWTAGVVEAQHLALLGFEATAPSLFDVEVFGVAVALANAVGGFIYCDYGYRVLFAATTLVAVLGAVSLASGRDRENGVV